MPCSLEGFSVTSSIPNFCDGFKVSISGVIRKPTCLKVPVLELLEGIKYIKRNICVSITGNTGTENQYIFLPVFSSIGLA
jgi:hypothetical protein